MKNKMPRKKPSRSAVVIRELLPDIFSEKELEPGEFMKKYWGRFQKNYREEVGTNGKVFEELIAISLIRAGIAPVYLQAKVAFIPNVQYDFVIYTRESGPLVLSAKTSLRERYKQADLEAVALKYIHRKSKSYVLTMNEHEAETRKTHRDGIMAIDDFIYAGSSGFGEVLQFIKTHTITESPRVQVVESNFILTRETCAERYACPENQVDTAPAGLF